MFQRWVDRIAREVMPEGADTDDAQAAFRARVIGAATMGMVDAVTRHWVVAPASVSFVELYDAGFEVLAPLLES